MYPPPRPVPPRHGMPAGGVVAAHCAGGEGGVQFGARRGPLSRPVRGVPAVAEQDPVAGVAVRVRTHQRQGLREGAGPGQVEAREGETGRRGVDVRVGEGRGDQGPFEVDHLVGTAREGVGRPFGAHPGDAPAFDDHRGGERIGGAVDVSTAQQHGAVFALGHGTSLPPARERSGPRPLGAAVR